MKVKATKLANGRLQLEIQDNGNGKVFMKFMNVEQMRELGSLISEESDRMARMENHFSNRQTQFNFQ